MQITVTSIDEAAFLSLAVRHYFAEARELYERELRACDDSPEGRALYLLIAKNFKVTRESYKVLNAQTDEVWEKRASI